MDLIVPVAYASTQATKKETSGGIAQFGINGWSLAFQVANFLIILLILQRWVIRPLIKRLQDREQTIAKSLDDAQQLEHRLQSIAKEREAALQQARAEEQTIIAQAREQAKEEARATKEHLHAELKRATEQTRRDFAREREMMLRQVRDDAADLVVQTAKQILGETLADVELDRQLIQKSLSSPSPSQDTKDIKSEAAT